MIGLPVTARTESAAPPRASPSSFVISTPSKSATSAKLSATLTASWPVIASTTSSTSWGLVTLADPAELVHQLLVHVEAAGRVDDQDVPVVTDGLIPGPGGHLDRVGLARLGVDVRLRLGPELLELLDSGGALQVAGGERDVAVILGDQLGELRAGGGLTGALETGDQDHGRPAGGEDEVPPGATHQRGELVVDGLDHRLTGVERLRDLFASEPLLERRGEVLDHHEVDVRFEQGEAHLAQGLVDVVLGELAARADVGEHALQAL